MAEAVENTSNEQPKAKRPAKKSPRIDMTPMVDLAFLLLTFFVLTSNLNEPKAITVTYPAVGDPSPIDNDLARTVLIDGSGSVFYYAGKLEDNALLEKLDMNSFRTVVAEENAGIQSDVDFLETVYTSGKFTAENYRRLEQIVAKATQTNSTEVLIVKTKSDDYSASVASMDADVKSGTMSEATFKKVGSVIRGRDEAPVFVVRWGNEAKYDEVIDVIDELRIGNVSKYVVTEISLAEYRELHEQTGRNYPELQNQAK
jgi:biopolymer transport protein ExbD